MREFTMVEVLSTQVHDIWPLIKEAIKDSDPTVDERWLEGMLYRLIRGTQICIVFLTNDQPVLIMIVGVLLSIGAKKGMWIQAIANLCTTTLTMDEAKMIGSAILKYARSRQCEYVDGIIFRPKFVEMINNMYPDASVASYVKVMT